MPKERVLIVDDEKNIVSSLQEILTDEGYEIVTAEDGLDALEVVQSEPPDLVLLDIWIPGMDGIEVLQAIKTYHPEIEVLVMSGHGTIDTAVKATKLGAVGYLMKPAILSKNLFLWTSWSCPSKRLSHKEKAAVPAVAMPPSTNFLIVLR